MLNYIFYRKGKVALFVTCSFFVSSVGTVCFASAPGDSQRYTPNGGYNNAPWTPGEDQALKELCRAYEGRWDAWGDISEKMNEKGYRRTPDQCRGRWGQRLPHQPPQRTFAVPPQPLQRTFGEISRDTRGGPPSPPPPAA